MAGHMSSDEFFTKLTSLLASTQAKGHGSIYLTQKRLTYDTSAPPRSSDLSDLNPPSDPVPILIRATDGNTQNIERKKSQKVKLSTVVQPDDLEAFFQRYAEVAKAGMTSLKKRDRSKRKKVKGKKKGGPAEGEKK